MEVGYPAPDEIIGSSDIGNVSRRVPSIHSYLGICEVEVNEHSTDFTECARSPLGIRAAITAAKSMASIGYDILTEEGYAEEIYREFEEKVPGQSGALIRYRNKKLRRGDL